MKEHVVCEAGILWRRVLRRLDQRVNKWLELGYVVKGIETGGWLRRWWIVCLEKP